MGSVSAPSNGSLAWESYGRKGCPKAALSVRAAWHLSIIVIVIVVVPLPAVVAPVGINISVVTNHGRTVVPGRRIVSRWIVVSGRSGRRGVVARRGRNVDGRRCGHDHARHAHADTDGPVARVRQRCEGSSRCA